MKKLFLSVLAITLVMVVACNKENEYHLMEVSNPYHLVYADHTLDSLQYSTTEVHTVKTEVDWCTVDGTYFDELNEFISTHEGVYNLAAILNIRPNTTGKTRDAYIHINSTDYSSVGLFRQLATLNVTRPLRYYAEDLERDSALALRLDGVESIDSVSFTVEGNWTLTADEGSFVSVAQNEGAAGSHVVHITAPANPGGERMTSLKLTSTVAYKENGVYQNYTVNDKINIIQAEALPTE